jgi:ABC-type oligopeptide transport system ATPase subunit
MAPNAVQRMHTTTASAPVLLMRSTSQPVPMLQDRLSLECGSDEEISHQPVYPSTAALLSRCGPRQPVGLGTRRPSLGEDTAAEAPEWGFPLVPGCPARSGQRCAREGPTQTHLEDGHLVASQRYD